MGEKLAHPPLVEAICEFRFEPSGDWDWTIPGRLYDKISGEFPERSQFVRVELKDQPGGTPPPQVIQGPTRVQLKRKDGSAMVQIGSNLLAINHLRPYEKWEAYRSLILNILGHYTQIAGAIDVSRIGLRYINRIEFTNDRTDLASLITLLPSLSGPLGRPLAGFYQRYELTHETPKGMLILQTGIQPADATPGMVVDLDFGSHPEETPSDRAAIESWLDHAHNRVHESFVAALNPDLYNRLKG